MCQRRKAHHGQRLGIAQHFEVFPGRRLLEDLPKPRLRAYPKETVVAENFHALCLLGMANSRMKDYFDLALLLRDEELDPQQLRKAIEATFARRQMRLPDSVADRIERCLRE